MLCPCRKFLLLEKIMLEDMQLPVSMWEMVRQRRNEIGYMQYLVVDEVTLAVPTLVYVAQNPESDESTLELMHDMRLQAAVGSIAPLVHLYEKVCQDLGIPNSTPVDLRLNYNWRALQYTPSAVKYRVDKENSMLRKYSQQHPSQWVKMCMEMQSALPRLLQTDSYKENKTRFLAPSPSLPTAKYDLNSFLAML